MSRRVAVALVLFFVSTATPAPTVAVAAGGDRVLHFFAGQPDGSIPNYGHLVLDRAGNLYGTTYFGGSGSCTQSNFNVKGCGTVFELSPRAGGGWNDRVLYSFKGGKDGSQPFGTVTLDAAGNIFGTTSAGGNSGCIPTWVYNGCGTVFELSPHSGAGWTERTLHIFTGGRDGGNPDSDLVLDGSENLYGTAYCGGFVSCYAQGNGAGVFFDLTRAGNAWNETVLYSFGRTRQNLAHPSGNLTPDGTGNIYGSTANGVYEMKAPSRSSHWSELTLYTLTNVFSQGYYPQGGLAFDGSGNLYGTMYSGGDPSCRYGSGCGVIFQLTPSPDGHWTESVLHTFTGRGDGAFPRPD